MMALFRGGTNPKGRQIITWQIVPEKCIRMKKFWRRGASVYVPPGSANAIGQLQLLVHHIKDTKLDVLKVHTWHC